MKNEQRFNQGLAGFLSITLLCAAHIMMAFVTLYAQPLEDDTLNLDPSSVRTSLAIWSRNHTTVKKGRPTFLFATSTTQCSGCGSSAINYVIEQIQLRRLPVNVLVVIASSVPKDGLALRSLFKTRNVSEDLNGTLQSVFNANQYTPSLYVLGDDGVVLYKTADIQHNQIDMDSLAQRLGIRTIVFTKLKLKTIKLRESDDYMIPEIAYPIVDPLHKVLAFVNPSRNLLYTYSLNGRRQAVVRADTDLDLYFKDRNDTSNYWLELSRHYAPMTKFEDIIRISGDTMQVLAKMFTGYDTLTAASGRHRINFRAGRAIVDFIRGRWVKVNPLPTSGFLIHAPIQRLSSGMLIAPCVWEPYYMDTTARHRFPDSLLGLLAFSTEATTARPLLPLVKIEQEYGRQLGMQYVKYIASGDNNVLFYVSDGDGVFLRCVVGDSNVAYRKIEPAGMLRRAFPLSDMEAGNLHTQDSAGVAVAGMTRKGDGLYILLFDPDHSNGKGGLVVQKYDMAGAYRGEYDLPLKENDVLTEALLAGFDGDNLVLITRWKTARWKIVSVDGIP